MSFLIKLQQNLFFSYLNPTSYLKSYKTELILAFLPIKNSFLSSLLMVVPFSSVKMERLKNGNMSYAVISWYKKVSKELKKIKR